ncbi:MAG: AMP-binding protein [Oscillospiraceae bacterium]|nr:AMP-binding protein [Oscillospiraceae bacterium]
MNKNYPPVAYDVQSDPANESCYSYYLRNTERYGEYTVFSHQGKEHGKAEFIADIEAMAAFFKNELKLGRGDVLSAFLPPCIEGIIVFYAVNKIGGIVNFIHPMLPENQVDEILRLTKSNAVITPDFLASRLSALLKKYELPCVLTVSSAYAIDNKYDARPNAEALSSLKGRADKTYSYPEMLFKYKDERVESVKENENDIAMFSQGGGTTGKSKTIMIKNSNLNHLVRSIGSILPVTEEHGVETEVCAMPFFHVYGMASGGLSAMHSGKKVIFFPKFEPDSFVKALQNNKVVQFNGVPGLFRKLLVTPGFDGPHLANLKVMYCGGDDVRPALQNAYDAILSKYGSQAQICAGWGLTECCASCTANPYYKNKLGSVGIPLKNIDVCVFDPETNAPLPQGEIGQLAVSGPTVMAGYLETVKEERGKGIYVDKNGKQWVLTGDLGKIDEDGYVVFAGRIKRLIIISGYNVYPNDIEKLLTDNLSYIRECCAVQGYDENGRSLVRLYIVTADGETDKEKRFEEIKELCLQKIHRFAVPRDIRYIDVLPTTPVGKIDFMKLTQIRPNIK